MREKKNVCIAIMGLSVFGLVLAKATASVTLGLLFVMAAIFSVTHMCKIAKETNMEADKRRIEENRKAFIKEINVLKRK